jgi:hypothetical protein
MTTRRGTAPTVEEHEDAPRTEDTKRIHSLAKQTLRTDIILGKVTVNCIPEEVYAMHNSYKSFPFNIFKTNLQSLIEAVGKDIVRMQHDCETYDHDLGVVKALRSNEKAGSRPLSWHLSDARNTSDSRHGSRQTQAIKAKGFVRD